MNAWREFWSRLLSPQTARFILALLAILAPVVRVISHLLLSPRSSFGRFTKGLKGPEPSSRLAAADARDPPARLRVLSYPRDSRDVPILSPDVSDVIDMADFAEVTEPVIVSVTIDVIDHNGPMPVRNSPHDAMSCERLSSEGSEEIAILPRRGKCPLASAPRVPLAASGGRGLSGCWGKVSIHPREPDQHPFLRAAFNAIAQIGNVGHRVLSHGAVPSHCGQGRALLTQRFRPAFYGRKAVVCQELSR